MKQFKRWAEKEYSLSQRILALIPAGALFVFLIPYLLARSAPALDSRLGFPVIRYGWVTLLTGGLLGVLGLFFALWSISDQLFRAQGTPLPVMATQKLLISGPFKYCRNPMTLGTIFLYLGISILTGSLSALAIVALLASMLILYLKKIEEKELEARFGEDYLEYKSRTPFLIPRIIDRRGKR